MTQCLIDLVSTEGQRLLSEVNQDGDPHQPFIGEIFKKQIGRRNCALQSAALVLNAAYLAKHSLASSHTYSTNADDMPTSTAAKQLPYAEESILDADAVRDVTSLEKVNASGTTLDELVRILSAYGCKVDKYHASESTVELFREKCRAALTMAHVGVIVNYHMTTLGQGTLGGHHSPLGAYHPLEDRFLLWDTWPETEVCWAKTDNLFRAMDTVDQQSNMSRGFCIVRAADSRNEIPTKT